MPDELRNRKTGKRYVSIFRAVVEISPSCQSPEPEIDKPLQFDFLEFSKSIKNQLGYLDEEAKQAKIRALFREYRANKSAYDVLFNNPQMLSGIHEQATMVKGNTEQWHQGSFPSTLAKVMLPAKMGIVGTLLMMAVPGAAQKVSTLFVPHTSQPAAGSDQGHLTKDTDRQFHRLISQAGIRANSEATEQLRVSA